MIGWFLIKKNAYASKKTKLKFAKGNMPLCFTYYDSDNE